MDQFHSQNHPSIEAWVNKKKIDYDHFIPEAQFHCLCFSHSSDLGKKYNSNNIIIGELLPAQQLILPSTAQYWVCKENLLLM